MMTLPKPNGRLFPQEQRLYGLLVARLNQTVTYEDAAALFNTHPTHFRHQLYVLIAHIRDHLPRGCEIIAIRNIGYKMVSK